MNKIVNNILKRIFIQRKFDAAAFDFTVFGFSLGFVTMLIIALL